MVAGTAAEEVTIAGGVVIEDHIVVTTEVVMKADVEEAEDIHPTIMIPAITAAAEIDMLQVVIE